MLITELILYRFYTTLPCFWKLILVIYYIFYVFSFTYWYFPVENLLIDFSLADIYLTGNANFEAVHLLEITESFKVFIQAFDIWLQV